MVAEDDISNLNRSQMLS